MAKSVPSPSSPVRDWDLRGDDSGIGFELGGHVVDDGLVDALCWWCEGS